MKKLLLMMLGVATYVSSFAAGPTNTTVYFAVQTDYTMKVYIKYGTGEGDGDNLIDMTKTDKTYFGIPIYSANFDDKWSGLAYLSFQAFNGESYQWEDKIFENKWTSEDNYNKKMHVQNTTGWTNYKYDGVQVTYHIQANNNWTPSHAYAYTWFSENNEFKNNVWPGNTISENPWNSGWYDYVVTDPYENLIFNNGVGGNGNQTGDITIDSSNSEYWYTYTVEGESGSTESVGKPANWLDDYQRTGLTPGNFGSICLPFDATIEGATVYKIVSKVTDGKGNLTGINLESVSSLEAGKAYIFKATSSTITATTTGSYTEASEANGMIGNLGSTLVTVPQGNYVVGTDNLIHKVTGDKVTCGQYKAYINLSNVNVASARGAHFIGFDEEATGIENVKAENGQETVYNLNGQRVAGSQKGLLIVNGKKLIKK